MPKLKINYETGFEDIQTINSDIPSLYNQFITVIDKFRSLSQPSGASTAFISSSRFKSATQNNFKNVEINSQRPLESRVNCFYRMIGFPVMDSNGSFYNPGFEPNSYKNLNKREKINNNLLNDQKLQSILNLREFDVITRRKIFVNQDFSSTTYALDLRYIRSFSNFNKALGPLEKDEQLFYIHDRESFKQQRHILRPFIVDNKIADIITPAENIICAPFLRNKEETKIDVNKPLFRPIIEFICRLRLQQESKNTLFLKEVQRLINGSSDSTNNNQDLKNTIFALTGENDLSVLQGNESFNELIGKFTSVQINTLNMLVKTIKVVLKELDNSIRVLDSLIPEINFEPIPSVDGPEFGGSIRTVGGSKSISTFEQKIGLLKILDLNAKFQQKVINERLGGGNELFAMSVVATQKNYSNEIDRLTRERDELGNEALYHLANIEKIMGEVSGLGLIDVLVIYTALWSIDLDTLIGLLDDSAFERLYEYNPELRVDEVEARHSGSKLNGIEVLSRFEQKVFNIFSFADNIFDQMRKSPSEVFGGDIG